jgi:arylsulfatase A-like enzyme
MADIILLVVDTLRRKEIDNLGSKVAPFLMSEEGEYFDNYYSNAPWTPPAHASMFTGKLPSEHGVNEKSIQFDTTNKLLNNLSGDYYKLGLSENGLVSDITGFSRGFDNFEYVKEENKGGEVWKEIWQIDQDFRSRKEKWAYFLKESIKRKDLSSHFRFLSYIKEKVTDEGPQYNSTNTEEIFKNLQKELEKDRNSFVFCNITPVHNPYTFSKDERQIFFASESEEEILESTENLSPEDHITGERVKTEKILSMRKKAYKAAIRYADKKIENLYSGIPEETILIVTGDHGELLGEQEISGVPITGHHFGTFKELVEVPFFIFKKKGDVDFKTQEIFNHRDIPRIVQE